MAYGMALLAPAASTGNNTHTAVSVDTPGAVPALEFVVEAVGATPTVTWKFQGSFDNVTFYDLAYVTDASDTLSVATIASTATGRKVVFPANGLIRAYKYYRLVTSANTNVTYRAEANLPIQTFD